MTKYHFTATKTRDHRKYKRMLRLQKKTNLKSRKNYHF